MNKKIILFNNKKKVKLLMLGLLIMILGSAMLSINLQTDRIITVYVLAFAGLALTGLIMVIALTLRMISKEQGGLSLDDSGLDFKSTSLGRSIGKISWQDIQAIQTGAVYSTNQLFVKLKNPGQYAKRISNPQMQKVIMKDGLPLNASELEIGFHEMETLIMQYYHRYT